MKKYYFLGTLSALLLSTYNLSAMEEGNTSCSKQTIKKGHIQGSKTAEHEVAKIRSSIDEAINFSRYNARPAETTSPEEVWDRLHTHFLAQVTFHTDMIEMYDTAQTMGNRKTLKELFKRQLGFDLPSKTDPHKYAQRVREHYNDCKEIWELKLAGITGEYKGMPALKHTPSYGIMLRLQNLFTSDICNLHEKISSALKNMKASILQSNKLLKDQVDELWALRYGLALVTPWASSEAYETYEKEQAQKKLAMEKSIKEQEEKKLAILLEKDIARREKNKRRRQVKKEKFLQQKQQEHLSASVISITNSVESEVAEKPDEKASSATTAEKGMPSLSPTAFTLSLSDYIDDEMYNPEAYAAEQRKLSSEKEHQRALQESAKKDEKTEVNSDSPSQVWPMKARFYNVFMDLFSNERPVAFSDFEVAFKSGLGGKIYKNKGGSTKTFTLGKFSFNLHKPHGGKGAPTFYPELRSMAIARLGDCGITKENIYQKNRE